MTKSGDSLRARILAEYGQELRDLESAIDEIVTESIGEWLESTSIELGEENDSSQPIDPVEQRALAERLLAISAVADLLDRVHDPGDEREVELRGQVFDLRRKACLDLFAQLVQLDGTE